MNWQQFTSPALPARFGHEHWPCCLVGCRAGSTSVGVSIPCTNPWTHAGWFLSSLPPVKSRAIQTFKNIPTR